MISTKILNIPPPTGYFISLTLTLSFNQLQKYSMDSFVTFNFTAASQRAGDIFSFSSTSSTIPVSSSEEEEAAFTHNSELDFENDPMWVDNERNSHITNYCVIAWSPSWRGGGRVYIIMYFYL